ncbi:MAG: carboxypeptidase-like regulatory domain-containing protein [Acidobacteriaceae bacterium]
MKSTVIGPTCIQFFRGHANKIRFRIFTIFLACFLTAAIAPSGYGQATGSLSGNATDKSGSAIAGAAVSATSQGTGLVRTANTESNGHYLIPLLPVGTYTVHIDANGFQSAETKDLRLQVDEARELDFALVPATVVTTVAVTGDAVAVEAANPSLGQVITSREVAQLPLNGRDFVQLATLTSGATAETNPNSFFTSAASSEVAARGSFSLSVGGSRPNSSDWILDNVDNNELTAGGISIFSSIDDIEEFKVLTYTYSAEYGTRAGPTVLVTSKSGTNNLHGTLYEFLRNTSLDAKSYFATSAEKFNLNDFGGSVGGPIRKNKTFFFIDGEQKYQLHEIPFTGLVPSLAMRTGDFSSDAFGNPAAGLVIVNPNMVGASTNPNQYPNVYFQCDAAGNPLTAKADGSQAPGTACNKVPGNLVNPIGQAMINLYPAPNANNASAGINYVNQPVRELDNTRFDIRLDQTFTNADSGFGRFSYDQAYSFVPGGSPGFAEANAFGSNQRIRNHARNIALGETHVFNANMVNQATFGYNRIFDYIASQGTGTCISSTIGGGIPNANLGCAGTKCLPGEYSCGLVSTEFQGGYWALGDRGYSPFQGGTNIFSFRDSLDIIRARHDFHLGIDYRANQMNVGTEAFQDGFWIVGVAGNFTGNSSLNLAGNSEADFLMGITGLAVHDQTYEGPVTGRRWKLYRPFVEDNWRLTPNITLNLGLAWDLTTPITEQHGRQADYIPSTGQLLIANQNGVSGSAGIGMDWTGLEPRVGGTWKVFGSDKTVLRGGFAIFHDSAWSQGAQGLWQNPPFLGESDAFGAQGCAFATSYCSTVLDQSPSGVSLSNGFQSIPTPPNAQTFQGSFNYEPTDIKHGRVYQYNVNIERQIWGNVVLTAGYAGSEGTHILVIGNNLTTGSPTACGTVQNYTLGCNANGSPYSSPYVVPDFNNIFLFGDVGKTTYNSLQIKAETKTSKGLYALFAYTYSRTYDNGLTDGLGSVVSAPYFPLPNWQNLDWALSQINLDNSFVASVIYDLPFGRGKRFGGDWNPLTNAVLGNWQTTVIQRISSGFPVPLIDSINNAGNTFSNGGNENDWNRPDRVAGCNPGNAAHGKLQWINSACFVAPQSGELGDASRAPATGPDFVNTDFSVIKQIGLPREMALNFRAEIFNLFNHAQFGAPVNDVSAPGFGFVQSTVYNPRLVQFGLKLLF